MKCEKCDKNVNMFDRATLDEFAGQVGLTVECDCGAVYEAWVDSWRCRESGEKTQTSGHSKGSMQAIGLKCEDKWVFAERHEDGTCRLFIQAVGAKPDSEITLDPDSLQTLAAFFSAQHYDNNQ